MAEQWTKIVVGRHGITDRNARDQLLSRVDDPLTSQGKEQALGLKNSLAHYTFTDCYSSPLSRAYETAWIVIGEAPKVILDERIIERRFGRLEGQSYSDTRTIRENFLENQPESWANNPNKIETDNELDQRVLPFLKEIAIAHLGIGPVFVASHSGIMRYTLNHLGHTYAQTRGKKIPNCGYLILESNGRDIRLAEVDSHPDFKWLKDLMVKKA